MKPRILSNWTFIRCLRLGLGIAILVQAIMAKDMLLVIAGLIFITLPVFSIGCCGNTGCAVPPKPANNTTNDIMYEEVV